MGLNGVNEDYEKRGVKGVKWGRDCRPYRKGRLSVLAAQQEHQMVTDTVGVIACNALGRRLQRNHAFRQNRRLILLLADSFFPTFSEVAPFY